MPRVLRFLAWAALLSVALSGQERQPGVVSALHFTAASSSVRDTKVTPAELKAVQASAARLASLIAEVPALNPPLGFNGVLVDTAGRRAPACVTNGSSPERWRMRIVPRDTPGCRPVVEANLGLFNPRLPRNAIQLITVSDIESCRREVASTKGKIIGECAANVEVARQLDWKRVAALLEQ